MNLGSVIRCNRAACENTCKTLGQLLSTSGKWLATSSFYNRLCSNSSSVVARAKEVEDTTGESSEPQVEGKEGSPVKERRLSNAGDKGDAKVNINNASPSKYTESHVSTHQKLKVFAQATTAMLARLDDTHELAKKYANVDLKTLAKKELLELREQLESIKSPFRIKCTDVGKRCAEGTVTVGKGILYCVTINAMWVVLTAYATFLTLMYLVKTAQDIRDSNALPSRYAMLSNTFWVIAVALTVKLFDRINWVPNSLLNAALGLCKKSAAAPMVQHQQ